jgi:hypothetical protein
MAIFGNKQGPNRVYLRRKSLRLQEYMKVGAAGSMIAMAIYIWMLSIEDRQKYTRLPSILWESIEFQK